MRTILNEERSGLFMEEFRLSSGVLTLTFRINTLKFPQKYNYTYGPFLNFNKKMKHKFF